jgi:GT2 family glycosyltransferase
MKKVAVILLNYNNYSEVFNCVELYQKQEYIKLKIIIVDNQSTNNSYSILKKKYQNASNINVILSNRNGGYGYGNNVGLKYIKNSDFDFVIISNSDIRFEGRKFVSNLIKEYQFCQNVGFASPQMKVNGVINSFSAWKLPSFLYDVIDSLLISRILPYQRLIKYDLAKIVERNVEVDCIPGSLFIGRKEIFYEIGLFDENVFLFCEERILALKIMRKGYKNYLIKSLEYEHLVSKTISEYFSEISKRKLLVESRIYFHKNYQGIELFSPILRLLFKLWKIEFYIWKKITS